jgi:hypothetical protein
MCVAADGGSPVNLIGLPLLLESFFVAMGSFIGRVADGFDASCSNLRVCLVFLMDGLDSFVGHLFGLNSFAGLLVGNHIDF